MSFGDSTLVLGDQDPLANELNNAADCPACLIVVRGSQQGHRYALTRALMSLGREGDSDIVIDDPRVSRRQAQIVLDGATVKLIDGGSTNGTRINDEKIGPGQTVVLNKEDMSKKARYGIIAAGWILYLLIGLFAALQANLFAFLLKT